MNTEHYTYRVRWSAEDEAFVGAVAELPSLSWISETQVGAFEGIRALTKDVVEDMVVSGEHVPEAIADRSFSGKFLVRLTPESHRALAIAAAEQNVSLNRLAAGRLIGA